MFQYDQYPVYKLLSVINFAEEIIKIKRYEKQTKIIKRNSWKEE
jgi:hypothetical protein